MSGLEFDALGLVAVGGTALLAATGLATDRMTKSKWITLVARTVSVAVIVWAFAARHDTTWALAVAAGVLTAAELVAHVAAGAAARGGWRPLVAVGVGGVAAAAASAVDGDAAAALAVAGLGVFVLVAIATRRVGVVALPGLFVVAAHHLELARVADGDIDWVGLGVAIVGVLAAVVVLRCATDRRGDLDGDPRDSNPGDSNPGDSNPGDSNPGSGAVVDPLRRGPCLAVCSFAVALILLAQDAADLRAAGLLMAGGAVVATASLHPLGLVALVPGAAAAVEALGAADHPVHAVAGVSVLVVVTASTVGTSNLQSRNIAAGDRSIAASRGLAIDPLLHWPVVFAVVFAVVPVWGWSGADVGMGYNPAVAAAVATAGAVGTLAFARLRARGPASSLR